MTRNSVVAIDAAGTPTAWNPGADGTVEALAVASGAVYAGGRFTMIDGQLRTHVAAIAADGHPTAFAPVITGESTFHDVDALAFLGGTLYVGGLFTGVDGQPRGSLAAFDAAGNLIGWNPAADTRVWALAVSGGRLYVAGGFATIGGQPRAGLAAFDGNRALLPWSPPIALGNVEAIAAGPYGVVAGGSFTAVGAEPLSSVAWFCP